MLLNHNSIDKLNTSGVVELLENMFPVKIPTLQESMSSIQRNAGHQDVIAFLKRKLEDDQNGL